jgi:hypothetical protein
VPANLPTAERDWAAALPSIFSSIIVLPNPILTVRLGRPAFSTRAETPASAFEELGNPGWNWNMLKPYYKKAENFITSPSTQDTTTFDVNERGSDGVSAGRNV